MTVISAQSVPAQSGSGNPSFCYAHELSRIGIRSLVEA